MDGDKTYPTVCGTGTEDYFCGSYNFENPITHKYQEFTTPYSGLSQVIRPDGLYKAVTSFGLYRWHIMDPVRFNKELKVTIQDLGWRHGDDCLVGKYGRVCSRNVRKDNFCTNQYTSSISFNCT